MPCAICSGSQLHGWGSCGRTRRLHRMSSDPHLNDLASFNSIPLGFRYHDSRLRHVCREAATGKHCQACASGADQQGLLEQSKTMVAGQPQPWRPSAGVPLNYSLSTENHVLSPHRPSQVCRSVANLANSSSVSGTSTVGGRFAKSLQQKAATKGVDTEFRMRYAIMI